MATLDVPGTYPTIAAALAVAVPTDTIVVAAGYPGNEVVTVGVNNVSFDVPASVAGIELRLAAGIIAVNLLGDSSVRVLGNSAANIISGNAGSDALYGDSGDDTLVGGPAAVGGTNQLWGGEGIDTASYAGAVGAIHADLAAQAGYVDAALVDQMNSIENLVGGAGDDVLAGDGGVNVLSGADGNDALYGQGGNDILIAGAVSAGGTNQLWGGTGSDTASYAGMTGAVRADLTAQAGYIDGVLVDQMNSIENLAGGSGNDVLIGSSGTNTLSGGGGDDSLDGGRGADTMLGGSGDDIYYVNHDGDVVVENPDEGADTVVSALGAYTLPSNVENLHLTKIASDLGIGSSGTGNDLSNTIYGTAVMDTIDGGAGADTMVGGLGYDTYFVDSAGDIIVEEEYGGHDSVLTSLSSYTLGQYIESLTFTSAGDHLGIGSALANMIRGGSGGDTLSGLEGSDTLEGNDGDDVLDGGTGIDTMIGGTGDDKFYVDDPRDVVIEAANEGVDWLYSSVNIVVPANVERLILTGTDNIDGTGNELNNSLSGNVGNNVLSGDAGADVLYGQGGDDILIGGATASGSTNQLWGGTGSDTASYVGTTWGVYVDLAAQAGYVAGVLVDQMNSVENANGGSGNDVLVGDATANVLNGAAGADALYGQDGDDTLIGGTTAAGTTNQLWGGSGSDTASYVGTSGTVHADLGAQAGYVDGVLVDQMNSIEHLTGGSGNNFLIGDAAANVLTGGANTDYLYGQDGNDTLIGGAAAPGDANQLWGGTGSDTASYAGTTGAAYADLGAQAGYVSGVLVDLMNSIENLIGGSNADTLLGDAGANRLLGGGGGDALWGRGGADVFVYQDYADSNLVTGYDVIGDFVSGTSKLDLTALGINASRIVIQSDGGSTSLYVEATPGAFDPATDLAISFAGANAIGLGDILL